MFLLYVAAPATQKGLGRSLGFVFPFFFCLKVYHCTIYYVNLWSFATFYFVIDLLHKDLHKCLGKITQMKLTPVTVKTKRLLFRLTMFSLNYRKICVGSVIILHRFFLCLSWSVLGPFTTQNLLRITFSTVCYFCVFVINMKIDLKELNKISASCTLQIDNLSTR